MLRNIFAVIAGVFAMMIVITFVELLGVKLFPVPVGLDPTRAADLPAIIAAMPLSARLLIVAGWCLGALVGAAVAAGIADRRWTAATVVGALLVVGTLANARQVPHPHWMIAAGTVLPLPLAWLAAWLVPHRKPAPAEVKTWTGDDR